MLDVAMRLFDQAGWLGFGAVGFSVFAVAAKIFGWDFVLKVAMFRIPIPAILLIAAVLFATVDKQSAMHRAVSGAVADLVAGEELAASAAKADGLQQTLDFTKRLMFIAVERAERSEAANNNYAARLASASALERIMQDEIDQLQCDADADCVGISDAVFNSLRSNRANPPR